MGAEMLRCAQHDRMPQHDMVLQHDRAVLHSQMLVLRRYYYTNQLAICASAYDQLCYYPHCVM
jgi:hypothetical protein